MAKRLVDGLRQRRENCVSLAACGSLTYSVWLMQLNSSISNLRCCCLVFNVCFIYQCVYASSYYKVSYQGI